MNKQNFIGYLNLCYTTEPTQNVVVLQDHVQHGSSMIVREQENNLSGMREENIVGMTEEGVVDELADLDFSSEKRVGVTGRDRVDVHNFDGNITVESKKINNEVQATITRS